MATQSNLSVIFSNRVIAVIQNALSRTIEHIEFYDGSNYRNILGAAELGREIDATGLAISFTASSISGNPPPTITPSGPFVEEYTVSGGSAANFTGTRPWEDTPFSKDDRFNETDPRNEKKLRTMFRWWTGLSYAFPVTTALNSTTVTVSSTSGFSVGQNLAAAGIPSGSIILEIINGTTFRISQPATAAASVTGIVSSGTCVGEAWADEIIGTTYGGAGNSTTPFASIKRL